MQRLGNAFQAQGIALPAPPPVPQLGDTITPSHAAKGSDLREDKTTEEATVVFVDNYLDPRNFVVEKEKPGFSGPFASAAKIIPVSSPKPEEAVSAAARSTPMPLLMLPLHVLSPVMTTSFSGLQAVGSGLLNFVKTGWGQLSANLGASDSTEMFSVDSFDEAKNNTSDETNVHPMPHQMDGFALAQVTIPLVSKMCKRHGLFGYKPLTADQITHYRTHYEVQLKLMKASLDEMLKHPILQRRKEIHLAEEALKQAQSRFKDTFKKKSHLKTTRSQQADIDHLVEIAQENLQCAKAVQAKVEKRGSELMDELCEGVEMNIAHEFLGEPAPQYPQHFFAPTRCSVMQPLVQERVSVNGGEVSNPLALTSSL